MGERRVGMTVILLHSINGFSYAPFDSHRRHVSELRGHRDGLGAPPPRPSRGVIMISSVSTNDVRRFLLCMRVYSTVAVQGTCTFLLCLGLVLAFPHLKGTVFLLHRLYAALEFDGAHHLFGPAAWQTR